MPKRKILLALSDAAHANRLRDMMAAGSYTISTAVDQQVAIQRIAKTRFDAVILDATPWGADKKAAARKLLKAIGNLPVVILGGDAADINEIMRTFGADRRYLCWRQLDGDLLSNMLMTVRLFSVGQRILGESEERFSKVFETSPGMFVISTPKDGRHIDVNDRWLSTLGFKRHEVIGKTALDLGLWVDPKDRSRLVRQLLKGGSVRGYEASFRAKQGDILDFLISGELIESGGEQLLLLVAQDISKRRREEAALRQAHGLLEDKIEERTRQLQEQIEVHKRMERALKLSEQRHRDMAEADSDWLWEMDAELRFSHYSDSIRAVLGFDPDEYIGKKRKMIAAHGEDAEKWKWHERTLKGKKPFRNFRYQLENPHGKNLFIQISGKPVFDDGGTFVGYRGTGTNVTNLQRAEDGFRDAMQRAETANKAKSNFLAGMSHELRTPLNAIIGFSDAIKAELFGPVAQPQYREYVDNIHDSGRHLLNLINDVLDVSKIEAGALEMHEDEVNISSIIDRAMRLVATRAETGGIKLKRRVKGDLPALLADERRIIQILLNLLSNAVKFTRKKGTVEVSAGQWANGKLFLRVSDTGIGIKERDIGKIMSEFGRVDNSLASKDEGTGLGLPLTKGLVESHGGTMKIKSKPGKGTTVTVLFPASRTLG
ncbi:MAG: PAS domain S-box protein [Alphaproteobacteria bacterium]